ncbi:MAG TPA: AbrB/MazE/SpoVT family DNA-binding domain-containing protein [Candidatus Nanoarchaeia archaeon]|nr:AbrB/MazE/SpoVT family DNA-binding domain-containing protein [Candidatus Nanoarchaeia archaeon]
MVVETIKMSSKGQIAIPKDIREEIHATEGTVFAVMSGKDSIVLKKITIPSKEDLIKEIGAIALEGRKRAERMGIKESDVPELVQRVRRLRK